MTAVIDASVLTAFYASADVTEALRNRLAATSAWFAPVHLDVEVLSALRRLAHVSSAVAASVPAALAHLSGFPLRRMPLAPLLDRMWELRQNITPCEAAYVALAEKLDAPLLTLDRRLAGANGARCSFEVLM